MNFTSTVETIHNSQIYKDFVQRIPHAQPYAAFFIIDLEGGRHKRSLDYINREIIYTFSIDEHDKTSLTEDTLLDSSKKLEPMTLDSNLSLEELELTIKDIVHEEGIGKRLQKIIAVLQNRDGKQIWSCTCIIDQFTFLHVTIHAKTKEVEVFEKKSLTDFVRKT